MQLFYVNILKIRKKHPKAFEKCLDIMMEKYSLLYGNNYDENIQIEINSKTKAKIVASKGYSHL